MYAAGRGALRVDTGDGLNALVAFSRAQAAEPLLFHALMGAVRMLPSIILKTLVTPWTLSFRPAARLPAAGVRAMQGGQLRASAAWHAKRSHHVQWHCPQSLLLSAWPPQRQCHFPALYGDAAV